MDQLKRDLVRLKDHSVEDEKDALIAPLLVARVKTVLSRAHSEQLDPEAFKILTNYTLTDCCDELPSLTHTIQLLALERQHPLLERFCRLLTDRLLSSLSLENFAEYLSLSHEHRFENLKQGILRFALHNYDSLLIDPSIFLTDVRDAGLVAELFQLAIRWKDETLRRPLYSPIPPSTFLTDLKKLFMAGVDCMPWDPNGECVDQEAVLEDLQGDCRLLVPCLHGEEVFMAHKCILVARSDFFEAALLRGWSHEKKHNLVSLQHINYPISRDAMLAFLYFLYTASTSRVTTGIALDVLEILGAGAVPRISTASPATTDPFGFLQIHGGYELWKAAEAAAGGIDTLEDAVRVLGAAERVGSNALRDIAIEICIHFFDDFNKKYLSIEARNDSCDAAGMKISSGVLLDVCNRAFNEFGSFLPPPAINERWEAVASSKCDGASLKSLDLSCGCSVVPAPGRSEAYIQLDFKRHVRVRLCRIGIDLMQGDWDADNLNGARLQYGTPGKWRDTGVCIKVENGVVRQFVLPQAIICQYFRLVRHHCLCVGMLVLE